MFETLLPGLSHAENVHPLFIHFPIAFWMTSLAVWTIGLVGGGERAYALGRLLLYLGTLSAIPTAATGLWAEWEMGHDSPGHEFVHVHRNWMIATAVVAVFTTGVAFGKRKSARWGGRLSVFGLLLATNAIMVLGTDRGGFLVYEKGIGTHVTPAEEVPAEPAEEHRHHEPHGHGVHGD